MKRTADRRVIMMVATWMWMCATTRPTVTTSEEVHDTNSGDTFDFDDSIDALERRRLHG